MSAEKAPPSKSPGEAMILCEQCLRGSGWTQCYQSIPGTDDDRVCQNCDRPQVVRQPRRVSGSREPSRREDSKAMQEARAELIKLQEELKSVTGGSVH